MILHYLKISLRNLLKYKTHSLISAICLAVGIVCYALVCFFVQQQEKLADLPNCERRLRIEVSQSESPFFRSHEVKRMEEQTVNGLECVTIHSYGNSTEIEVIDDEQRNLPFLIRYKGINANYFAYNGRKLLYGNRLPEAPDEVVLSQQFVRKAYGNRNPIGSVIHLSNPKIISENPIQRQ